MILLATLDLHVENSFVTAKTTEEFKGLLATCSSPMRLIALSPPSFHSPAGPGILCRTYQYRLKVAV